MFCGHCGTKMEKVERFCTECGKEQLQENQGATPYPAPYSEPNQDSYTPAASDSNNKTALGIGMIATICAALVILVAIGIFLIFRTSYVEVPDFSNLTEEEAIELIEESRLTIGRIAEEYSGRVVEGLVISQAPRAGREVERGTSIDLTISLGEEPIPVPDFTGLRLNEATRLIENSDLILGDIGEEYSETVNEGVVISQSIPSGSQVEKGTSIDLVISLGPEMIDVVGLTLTEAIRLIEASHLRLGIVYEEYDDDVEEGIVIAQSLGMGTIIEHLDLVVSLGAPPISVNPFNTDVWGEEQIITLVLDDVSIDVPIPPWLNNVIYEFYYDEDYEFVDGVYGFFLGRHHFYLINRERDDLMTMIEVSLFSYTGSFEEAANRELDRIVSFLRDFEYISSITDTTIFYQSRSELTAGISSIEYSMIVYDYTFSGFELLKINHYNGIGIRTRLRLETVNAPEDMCVEEFADAFGLWRYIDAGYMELGEN